MIKCIICCIHANHARKKYKSRLLIIITFVIIIMMLTTTMMIDKPPQKLHINFHVPRSAFHQPIVLLHQFVLENHKSSIFFEWDYLLEVVVPPEETRNYKSCLYFITDSLTHKLWWSKKWHSSNHNLEILINSLDSLIMNQEFQPEWLSITFWLPVKSTLRPQSLVISTSQYVNKEYNNTYFWTKSR